MFGRPDCRLRLTFARIIDTDNGAVAQQERADLVLRVRELDVLIAGLTQLVMDARADGVIPIVPPFELNAG